MKERSSRRFPRKPDFDIDLSTDGGALRYAEFYVGSAANIAGACMVDHPGDEGVIRDMHDTIGALAAAQNAIQLLAKRKDDQP